MKPLTLVGVLLILLGVAVIVFQGIPYTSREAVVDIGPVHATADREKTIPLSPILGIVAASAGVALLVAGTRRNGQKA